MGHAQLALGRVLKYEISGLDTLEGWVAGRDGVKTQEVWVLAWMLAKRISKTLKGHLRLEKKAQKKTRKAQYDQWHMQRHGSS